MFYYYGRKKKLAKLYPAPKYKTIIEPFAGSAAYSFHHADDVDRVLLIEKDPAIVDLWRWLIDEATVEDFEKMPDLEVGEVSHSLLHILHAVTKSWKNYKKITVTPILASNWKNSRRNFIKNLHKIKTWEVVCGDYTTAPDIEATWFIDPPYRGAPGMGYRYDSSMLDYDALASWVRSRKGEVICCEGEGADYLPFQTLTEQSAVGGKRNRELIYHRQ